jgi:cytochrome c biogenesis protein CcdA
VIAPLLESIGGGSAFAPALGLLAGLLLGLSPVALPAVPAAMSVLSPGRVQDGLRRQLAAERADGRRFSSSAWTG